MLLQSQSAAFIHLCYIIGTQTQNTPIQIIVNMLNISPDDPSAPDKDFFYSVPCSDEDLRWVEYSHQHFALWRTLRTTALSLVCAHVWMLERKQTRRKTNVLLLFKVLVLCCGLPSVSLFYFRWFSHKAVDYICYLSGLHIRHVFPKSVHIFSCCLIAWFAFKTFTGLS